MLLAPRLSQYCEDVNTIVHVGAHLGQELKDYIALNPRKIVYLEADPILYSKLCEIVQSNGLSSKVIVINALLAELDNIRKDFYVYNNHRGSSSIYRPTSLMTKMYPGLAPTGELISLSTSRLDTILQSIGIEHSEIDAIVYDIQGAEYSAILGTGAYLTNPILIETEVSTQPIYNKAPVFDDVNLLLSTYGYKLLTDPVPQHGDVIYINSRRLLNKE